MHETLLKRGQDVTRTPQPRLPLDTDDDHQLLWANAQVRVIFTHNICDFIHKTRQYPYHSGTLLAHRSSYSLSDLIRLVPCRNPCPHPPTSARNCTT